MVKKVRFSDKVDVHYMNVNLKEHSKEVKNPIGYQQSLAKKTESVGGSISPLGSISFISCLPSWVWWVLGIILVIVIIYFIRRYYFSDKEDPKEPSENSP